MQGTGAELIVECLKAEGVKYIFGMSASAILPLLDVVYRHPEIRYIQSQHEQGAIYMANGYARASRKTGFCLVGPGPGATNASSGVAQAFNTFVPSLLMSIEDGTRFYGLGSSMHHGLDAVSLFKPITKLSIRVERAGRIPDLMRMAFRTTSSRRAGPAYLGVPRDLLEERAEGEIIAPPHYRVEVAPRGDPREIARAAELLLAAKKTVALAGGEVGWSRSQEELIALAELLAMPVAASEGNKGVFPEDHPLALGAVGLHGTPYATQTIQEADVLLALGSPFTEFTTGFFEHKVVPKGAKIIQIDIDPTELGKIYPLEMGIVGGIKGVLQDLLQEVRERVKKKPALEEIPRIKALLQQKREWEDYLLPQKTSAQSPIHPLRLIHDLRQALPKDALVVGESGSTHGWFEYAFQALTHTMGIGSWHPMGAGYCECLGAQLAMPERRIVCLMGDGSMMMILSEIATAVAYNIPVLAVVRHNELFGNMRQTQIKRFGGRFIGTDLPIPHLANIAREFGAFGERVSEPNQIIPAIKRALDSGKPALLEIMMDTSPETLVPPTAYEAHPL